MLNRTTADTLRRLVAGGCAGLVLALTLFAASPAAHAWVHASEDHADPCEPGRAHPAAAEMDGCAIVLFAGGVDVPAGPVALVPPRALPQSVSRATAAEFHLVRPRYLHQPERGPPLG
jgi:hypothetical protein